MRKSNLRGIYYLILIGVAAAILTAGLISLQPGGSALNWLIRGVALLGYLAIYLSILSSAYARQLVRLFGRPFIQVHHILSIAGLALIALHPLGVALDWSSPGILFPRLDSLRVFLQWGGPPALYLIVVASLAAALRRPIGKGWRAIHILSYLAFLLATVHATLLGRVYRERTSTHRCQDRGHRSGHLRRRDSRPQATLAAQGMRHPRH